MAMVHVCRIGELPEQGSLRVFEVEGRSVCVANDGGILAMVDNVCPHRQGPLAEGSIENGKVLCPWHAWAFDLRTGEAEHNTKEKVQVFRFALQGGAAVAELGG